MTDVGLSGVVSLPVLLGEAVAENRVGRVQQPDETDNDGAEDLRLLAVLLGELTAEHPEVGNLVPALNTVDEEEERTELVEQNHVGGLEKLELELVKIADGNNGVGRLVVVNEERVHPLGAEVVGLSLGKAELLKMDNHEAQ